MASENRLIEHLGSLIVLGTTFMCFLRLYQGLSRMREDYAKVVAPSGIDLWITIGKKESPNSSDTEESQ